MSTWKQMLEDAMNCHGETLTDPEANTMTEDDMVKEFDSGFGGIEGVPFTAWSVNTAYFPICYDGAEWVGSVARHPDGKPSPHQGG